MPFYTHTHITLKPLDFTPAFDDITSVRKVFVDVQTKISLQRGQINAVCHDENLKVNAS